jgi:predicted phosphodiesterase
MRIAVTADLHWGHHPLGDEATRLLRRHLDSERVDLLLLGGDIGTGDNFGGCLELFTDLPCPCAVVPGNHDLWVLEDDTRGDSMHVYQQHLPGLCRLHGVHYLDLAPRLFPEADLAVVGTINWYDYSWTLDRLRAEVPNWEWHLHNKAFTRGRHNDVRFIRWASDDVSFTKGVVAAFREHLEAALAQLGHAIVLTHHPALYGLSFPRTEPAQGLDSLLWEALSGNTAIEEVLRQHADRIAYIFSGHTHRAAECRIGGAVGLNVGGDYHYKRLLLIDWPGGQVEAHVFGDPSRRR